MNLGRGAEVVMYEVGRGERKRNDNAETQRAQRRGGGPKRAGLKARATLKSAEKEEFAEMETVERIGEALLEALRKSGYIAARGEATAEEKLRRMLRRVLMGAAGPAGLFGLGPKKFCQLY